MRIKAKQQTQPISSVFGLLKDKAAGTVVSIEEMDQAVAAQKALLSATLGVVSPIVLCELYWVLSRAYKVSDADIKTAIRGLVVAANVRTDALAVDAGLMFMNNGGDFADGVLWHLGTALGGKTFVSFDKKAANILKAQKASVKLM